MRATLEDMAASGTTVVISSHNLHETQHLCGRIAVIAEGRILHEGAPSGLSGDGDPEKGER